MGIGVRLFCLWLIFAAHPGWGKGSESDLIHYDPVGNRLLKAEFSKNEMNRVIAAQSQGAIALGFNRASQDALLLEYAWSFLQSEARGQIPLGTQVRLPAEIAISGLIDAGFNSHELYSFISGFIGEGGFDLASLSAPLEACLQLLSSRFLSSGNAITISQFETRPLSDFIIQLYLANLIASTEESYPETFALVEEKQLEVMSAIVTQVSGLAAQMGGLRRGLASSAFGAEILKTIAGAIPPALLIERVQSIQKKTAGRDAETELFLQSLLQTAQMASQGQLRASGMYVRVLLTLISVFQRKFALPIAVLNWLQGSSRYQAMLPAAAPIQLVNEVTLRTYEVVEHLDYRLKADLEARYPGAGIFEKLGHRFTKDLRRRELQWREPASRARCAGVLLND